MKQIFINLPVKNLNTSKEFYLQLGFSENSLFTFNDQKCMVWSDQIYLMLQSLEMFTKSNKKSLSNAKENVLTTFTLPLKSISEVNDIVEKTIQSGGKEITPLISEEFMYLRNIEDLDGHNWGIMCLDMEKFKKINGI